jgi:hypothetical protein
MCETMTKRLQGLPADVFHNSKDGGHRERERARTLNMVLELHAFCS